MDLGTHVEQLQRQLAEAVAAGGEEARATVERFASPLEAAIRLALQDVVAVAVDEITCELAPGAVELRLRGRDLEFVVTAPPADPPPGGEAAGESELLPPPVDGDDGGVARINLRLPEQLKARVEQAAGREALSVNAWLVRAAAAALDRVDSERRRPARGPQGTQRYTGWAR